MSKKLIRELQETIARNSDDAGFVIFQLEQENAELRAKVEELSKKIGQLERQTSGYREALEYYADPDKWGKYFVDQGPVRVAMPLIARQALSSALLNKQGGN